MSCDSCNNPYTGCTVCGSSSSTNCTCATTCSDCDCPYSDISTDCSTYTGDDLPNSGVTQNTILTTVIQSLDAFVQNKFDEAINYLSLANVGTGAEVFQSISGVGVKQLRTLVSGDTNLLDVVQGTDEISINAGNPRMEVAGSILSYIVNTASGDTTLSTVDLSGIGGGAVDTNTFVTGAALDGANVLTLTLNDSSTVTVDLSVLAIDTDTDTNTFVASGAYSDATQILTLTLSDSSTVNVDLSSLLAEAAAAQVQANYLETVTTSKAYIQNKNASKSEVLGAAATYNVTDADNNYVIEISNGANNVTVDLSGVTATSDFFVGFIQGGTGTVTFTGADIIPSGLTAAMIGQGHTTALEIIGGTKYLMGGLST